MKKRGITRWSHGTVLTVFIVGAGVLALLWWIYLRRGEVFSVLSPFLAAFILAYIIAPVVHLLERRGVARLLSILLIYACVLLLFYVFIESLLPRVMKDLNELADDIPYYMEKIQGFTERLQEDYRRFNLPPAAREIVDDNLAGMEEWVVSRLQRSYAFIFDIFNLVLALLLVPVLAFYILFDEKRLKESALMAVPLRYRRKFKEMIREVDSQLGAYLRGIIIVSFSVGVSTYLGFLLLGVEFPLILGIINGLTNLIPYLGPFLGAVPAVLVALLSSPTLAIKVVILIVVVQQLESQLLSPLVLGRSINFHPLAIILILLLGGRLFGFLGLVLALPVAVVLRVVGKQAREALQKRAW